MVWRIELLGGLQAQCSERVITHFGTRKTESLLAYLAYHRRAHSRAELIEMLWPERPPKAGRNSLSVALSTLRRQLEPSGVPTGSILRASHTAVELNATAVITDVEEFQVALRSAGEASSIEGRVQFLAVAIDLYQGALLPGFYESWIISEEQHLEELFSRALHQLIKDYEAIGDFSRALQYAEHGVSMQPLYEEAHYDLMRLLRDLGRPTAALRQYHALEQILNAQLSEAPSAATRALAPQIEQHVTTQE